MLNSIGIHDVFAPKSYPVDARWVSADVAPELDATLSIPSKDLAILNGADWYGRAGKDAWQIANKYFQFAFIGPQVEQIDDAIRHFAGTILLRAWGHLATSSFYSDMLYQGLGLAGVERIRALGNRFWFAPAYQRLAGIEHEFLRQRSCYLPLGLPDAELADAWRGEEAKLLFVCPQINAEPYYHQQYTSFLSEFGDLPHVIGGAQPVVVADRNVIGFVPRAAHDDNMGRLRVMFYSGNHPNHVHYHPLEAVKVGMPLVFMAGSLLDEVGGAGLPGRCTSTVDARRKLKQLLAGDRQLADQIRSSQRHLLEKFKPSYCAPIWQRNFEPVLAATATITSMPPSPRRRRKIAVLLIEAYRGGTLKAAKSIANALYLGSQQAGEPADIVFGHLDNSALYPASEFADLDKGVTRRSFQWQVLQRDAAQRVLRYRGHEVTLGEATYCLPQDGIGNFLDCDLWMLVSDRISAPLLPLRPQALMVFDYVQRYQPTFADGHDTAYLRAAREAAAVMVTTKFTRDDALQYAGVDPKRLHLLPLIFEPPPLPAAVGKYGAEEAYFVWPTNTAAHKNQLNSLRALEIYYGELDGTLQCRITGVNTHNLFSGVHPELAAEKTLYDLSPLLQKKLIVMGELPEASYRRVVTAAEFLWHTVAVDNGTFSVLEAACLRVPALSTRYPAIREMDDRYRLNLAWCEPDDPDDMAGMLKQMEGMAATRRADLPSRSLLEANTPEALGRQYWQVVSKCL